ncbi:MAG: D-(-)-3-hydroxybutyrate oligomer hydrolase [Ideonella sp. WA131b]|jgi:hydroxybutyrate-dimer hydrolase|nr:D-(-)-3-hydroxybutyrate oligomer hydrolase [Ideonella sp. WA131b]
MIHSLTGARTGLALAALAALAACGSDTEVTIGSGDYAVNTRPAFLVGAVRSASYDGTADDLLTAGLGRAGLASAVAPTLSAAPTAAELRKLAIHTNYRAIVDTTAGGGFGTLYGPNIMADGTVGTGDGKIAGTEHIGIGPGGVTMMVQVPSSFSASAPCIVTAASSGSRGVYGAIGSAGEWGLKRGCAVAYTDKGTGNGVHDLQNDTVNRYDGTRATAAAAGSDSNFTAALSAAELTAFNAATPNRFAVKHAHSGINPEADWGTFTLQAVEFAFYVLNQQFGAPLPDGSRTKLIVPGNTIVIASSVSNGAGAALAAAENDGLGLIDGVAVSEPNIQMAPAAGLSIERGTLPAYTGGSKPLYDYFSYANLLQPCAALATAATGSPFGYTGGTAFVAGNRCASLAANGLVTGATTLEQANDALARLRAYGWEPESDLLHASHYLFASPAIAVTYANAHGRFPVQDNLCGFSFGAVDGAGLPTAAAPAAIAGVFGTGNGVPPSGALQLIWNNAVGGARNHGAAASPSTGALDFAFDGALCLRNLWAGAGAQADAVRAGVVEVRRSANLRGTPTIIVHGRNDTLVPPNFSSRPYLLRNAQVEGAASRVRYVEVTNAQHFDSFLPFPGYDTRFIPLHVYFNRAMDAMWAHLKNGAALPPSQVVRTTPRGGTPGAATAIAASNVPAIAANPPAGDRITIDGSTLRIPE